MGVLAILALVLGAAALTAPEAVALLGLGAIYLNLPGIAVSLYGVPALAAGASMLLLAGPLAVRLLRGEPMALDRPFLILLGFLAVVLASAFVAEDMSEATTWLLTFLTEGVLVYFAVSNLFRTKDRLRRALRVILLCGALLGALTLYQELSRTYEQQFGGLAQRNLEFFEAHEASAARDPFRPQEAIFVSNRAGGPIGEPNRFAQILLVLLPIVFFAVRNEERRKLRVALAACGGLILAGVLLTYSRGAFVALVVLTAILIVTRSIRIRSLALTVAALVLVLAIAAPGYLLRIATLQETPELLGGARSSGSEEVMRSRVTEMLAAWTVFVDHPVLGVGPGQYAPVYSETYMNNPDIAFKHIDRPRRAHNLYFELAAETGIFGIACFLGMVGLIEVRLWRAWRRWKGEREDLANLAAAFFLAIAGYLVSAVFLHLSYQRYYWLLLGLAAATLHVLAAEESRAHRIRQAIADLEGVAEPVA